VFHPAGGPGHFAPPETAFALPGKLNKFKKNKINIIFLKPFFYGRFLEKLLINRMLLKQNKFIFLNIIWLSHVINFNQIRLVSVHQRYGILHKKKSSQPREIFSATVKPIFKKSSTRRVCMRKILHLCFAHRCSQCDKVIAIFFLFSQHSNE
jgi:hypothetical protein